MISGKRRSRKNCYFGFVPWSGWEQGSPSWQSCRNRRRMYWRLAATREAADTVSCPVITMSMGAMGVISRVSGRLTGSCMTFGSAGRASAPGAASRRNAVGDPGNLIICGLNGTDGNQKMDCSADLPGMMCKRRIKHGRDRRSRI